MVQGCLFKLNFCVWVLETCSLRSAETDEFIRQHNRAYRIQINLRNQKQSDLDQRFTRLLLSQHLQDFRYPKFKGDEIFIESGLGLRQKYSAFESELVEVQAHSLNLASHRSPKGTTATRPLTTRSLTTRPRQLVPHYYEMTTRPPDNWSPGQLVPGQLVPN